MKTIPKQKRKLAARFLKAVLIAVVSVYAIKAAIFIYDFWGFEHIEYKDTAHVLEIFEENKDDFDAMVDVLQRTNINKILFYDYLYNPKALFLCSGEELKNPKYQIKRRGFLKAGDEDYKSICTFFKKYGPVRISGTKEFCFDFDIEGGLAYLCYIPENIRDIILKTLEKHYETIIPLDEYWYVAYRNQ